MKLTKYFLFANLAVLGFSYTTIFAVSEVTTTLGPTLSKGFSKLANNNQIVIPERHRQAASFELSNISWQSDTDGQVPNNAIKNTSIGNSVIYICQAKDHGEIYPGEIVKEGCLVSYGGKTYLHNQYKVLTGKANIQWTDVNNFPRYYRYNDAMFNTSAYFMAGSHYKEKNTLPLAGGFSRFYPNYLHPLFICRGLYGNALHYGKIVANQCNIGSGGREITLRSYQVLEIISYQSTINCRV